MLPSGVLSGGKEKLQNGKSPRQHRAPFRQGNHNQPLQPTSFCHLISVTVAPSSRFTLSEPAAWPPLLWVPNPSAQKRLIIAFDLDIVLF